MTSRRFAIALLGLAATLPVAPARAGAIGVSLGPQVGWSYTQDSKTSSPLFGGAARVRLLHVVTGELAVGYRREDVDGGQIETLPVQASVLLDVVPMLHLTAGIGWYRVDANLEAVGDRLRRFDDSDADAGLHVGAGIDLPLNARLRLVGDARYVFLGYELQDVQGAVTSKVDADFLSLTAGLQMSLF